MRNFKRNLLLAAGVLLSAVAPACTGFFVNPTLSSLAIGPQSQTITANPKQTLQMSATGTYSDGSTKDLTGKVSWSSSETSCATINSTGLVSPPASVSGVCTTTISASFGTVSAATTSVTVSEGTPTSINLKVSNLTPNPGTAVTFTAMATFPGTANPQDITSSVTWIDSDPTNVPLTQGSGNSNIPQTAPAEQVTIQASFDGVTSNQVVVTIQ
jgi:Big-like domain-containing protein